MSALRGRERWWALVLVVCLLLAGCSMTARRAASGRSHVPAPVVVVGVGGLTWDAVSPEDTPRLWRLLDDGAAAGAVAVRQIGPSCPADGWLSLSSGRPTAGPRSPSERTGDSDGDGSDGEAGDDAGTDDDELVDDDVGDSSPAPVPVRDNGPCGPLPEVFSPTVATDGSGGAGKSSQAPGEVVIPEWRQLQDLQDSWEFAPQLGLLADSLGELDVCATAVGPGAALTLADSEGVVHRYQEALGSGTFDCPVTVIDAGSVTGRDRDLAVVDRRVGDVLDRVPEDATVLVTGISEEPGGRPELAGALLWGPPVSGTDTSRFLVTSSTRWDGVLRLLDVPSTLMAAVDGADPDGFSGAPIRLGGRRPAAPEETARVLDDVTRAEQVRGIWAGDFRTWFGAVQLVLYGVALLALAYAYNRDAAHPWVSGRSGRVFTAVVLWFAALPAAAYLVTLSGWWRAGSPGLALWAGMGAIAAGIAVAAGQLPKRPLWWAVGGVSLLTFAILVVDALAGTPLHRGSLLGPSPALGGRFFGFGNDTFCVFIVVALLLAGAVAAELLARDRRRVAVGVVVALGAVTVLVDVWPTWGADIGGGVALLPGIALLALVVAGVEVTVVRLTGAAVGGVALVAAIALVDWLRPERDRSHAGRFVQEIVDGDAWEIVARKAGYARDSLNGSIPMWITLAVLVVSAAALLRPERWAPASLQAAFAQWSTLRATLGAILLTIVVGSFVNDYGLRIATISLTMGLPLVALTCARAETPPSGGEGEAAVGQAGPRHDVFDSDQQHMRS